MRRLTLLSPSLTRSFRLALGLAFVAAFVSVLGAVPAQAQVCSSVALTSQAEVNAFACTEVTDLFRIGVFVGTSDITDLTPLAGLTSVGSFLTIENNDGLTSLAGLENIASAGFMAIWNNDGLTSLVGLENLTSVASLDIQNNDGLTSLSGLENLTSTGGGFLTIENNDGLTSLAGLDNLASGASLIIRANDGLTSLAGLENIASALIMAIQNNDGLTSLAGLENLTSVTSILIVTDNDGLTSLAGLENVDFVGGNLKIRSNAALSQCSCGLSGVISGQPPMFSGVLGTVVITGNDPGGTCTSPQAVLDDLCTLPLSGDLTATATTSTTVPPGGAVSFAYTITNTASTPAEGDLWFTVSPGERRGVIRSGTLRAGATVSGSFTQNVPVSAPPGAYAYTLNVGSLADDILIDSEAFEITVTGSARAAGPEAWTVTDVTPWEVEGETEAAVAAASEALPETFALEAAYPNPFASAATVGFALPKASAVRVEVIDVLGREVAMLVDGELEAGRHTARFEASGLASGVYLVRMTAGDFAEVQPVTLAR